MSSWEISWFLNFDCILYNLKTLQLHVDFMIREQNVQNFMDKVLKFIQLHEYHFSTNFAPLLYALAVQIWHIQQKFKFDIYGKNSLSDT
jgi:hypothetical protein